MEKELVKSKNLMNTVSLARLAYYEEYLNCISNKEKLSAYFAHQDLSSSFFPIIQMLEIALRNKIHHE
ncbi:hypothetical protein FHQ28_01155 [Pasteurellaceae bacterium USgator11]|nr:hypothetical protein FHQ19_10770 [Pasteurellaceae bacterium UScroc12]TNG95951.1 hypothetical protein FHQ20_05975 [Pasteurellaceae bacterium USgator41]TNG97216.1 hypothetical protein FHQ24_10945 [Pasteurellaceae bacterium UScroc31]TNH02988.1 hypothetical protein FHQ28_01155 [Pasteurellaceae bacterium USgator11]